jgi:periplasmic protein TonB
MRVKAILLSAAMGLLAQTAVQAAAPTDRQRIRNDEILQDSYPKASLKAGEQGPVQFQVSLDKRGKPLSCAVTKSSGYPRLDQATCDLIVRFARFGAPSDASGRRVPATHEGLLIWRLPDGYVPAADAPDISEVMNEERPDEIECRRSTKVGSLYIKVKMCLTRADWLRADDYAREEMIRLTTGVPGQVY